MKRLISRALSRSCVQEDPIVLVDVGASGGLPASWQMLAPHSIVIAFDADARDFGEQIGKEGGWRKRHLFNRLVTARPSDRVDFYLTRSPYCSSTLAPDRAALDAWAFRGLFEVDRMVQLPSMDLTAALDQAGARRIDWIKFDTQGTDLRLFQSLPEHLQRSVLAVDFEPGIIDAYQGEDKLHHVLAYMETLPLWMSNMQVRGSYRVDAETFDGLNRVQRRFTEAFLRPSPGWCEISYLNKCETSDMSERDLLVAWVFALLGGQYGFAHSLARRGEQRFGRSRFEDLAAGSRSLLNRGYANVIPGLVRRFVSRFR